MEYWEAKSLLQKSNRHIASEPHIRIEVKDIAAPIRPPFHGELLILVLRGSCVVKTGDSRRTLNAGDQVLLVGGEEFEIAPSNNDSIATVELIWTPGLNPCKVC